MKYHREYSAIKDVNPILGKNTRYKKLSGVCAGIAKYYNSSRLLVRVIAIVALFLFPVATAVSYVVASLLLPNQH
jgi:phage shock protein PspC (stress-responsive transcriptional regulator)